MSWSRDEGASAALMTVVLLPLLTLTLSGFLQLGTLRVAVARVRAAADLAALVAVNDQDDEELARTGALRLRSDAADVARDYFGRQLELSAPLLGASANAIAAGADIAAYPVTPAYDSRTATRYDRPTVRIAADVPLRTPLFGPLLLQPVTVVNVMAASSAR